MCYHLPKRKRPLRGGKRLRRKDYGREGIAIIEVIDDIEIIEDIEGIESIEIIEFS
jgi:hypothetical protein